jgi:hypothetical protein
VRKLEDDHYKEQYERDRDHDRYHLADDNYRYVTCGVVR